MAGDAPPLLFWVLLPPAALAAFALVWVGVTALVARIGGWHALAREYEREGAPPGDDLGLCSLSLGRGLFATNYNGAVRIGLGPEGLALRTIFLFRLSHPSLLIPWGRIRECGRRQLLFGEVTALQPEGSSQEILIRGEAGRRVHEYWQGQRRRPGGGWGW